MVRYRVGVRGWVQLYRCHSKLVESG